MTTPCVSGKCILRSRTSSMVLLATTVSTISYYSPSLRCRLGDLTCRRRRRCLYSFQARLPPPVGICLLFGVGHVHPASFAVGKVADQRVERGHGAADSAGVGTARHKGAAGGGTNQVRGRAFDGFQRAVPLLVQARNRVQQAERVGMARIGKEFI